MKPTVIAMTHAHGEEPLHYVISDHHLADVGIDTMTGKHWFAPECSVVASEDVDYHDG